MRALSSQKEWAGVHLDVDWSGVSEAIYCTATALTECCLYRFLGTLKPLCFHPVGHSDAGGQKTETLNNKDHNGSGR